MNETLNIVVHTHRSAMAVVINKLIVRLLQECRPDVYRPHYNDSDEIITLEVPKLNAIIHFRKGYAEELTDPIYKQTDILYSYSMVGGLSKELKSGSILFPDTFIPFDEQGNLLFQNKVYRVNNRMIDELNDILAQQQDKGFALLFDVLKNKFASNNKNKTHEPRVLTSTDFHKNVKLLQVFDLWHPTKGTTVKVMSDKNLSTNIEFELKFNRGIEMKEKIFIGTLEILTKDEVNSLPQEVLQSKFSQYIEDAINAGFRNFDIATAYSTDKYILTAINNAIEKGLVNREAIKICLKINDKDFHDHKYSVPSILNAKFNIKLYKNLRYLDIFMIHSVACLWHDKAEDVLNQLIKLKNVGNIKHIGISNFIGKDFHRLGEYLNDIEYNSIEVNPFCQRSTAIADCEMNNMTLMPFRLFAQSKHSDLFTNEVLVKIAEKYKITVHQLIVAWELKLGLSPVIKASKNHLADIKKACELVLEIDFLDDKEMLAIATLDKNQHTCGDVETMKKFFVQAHKDNEAEYRYKALVKAGSPKQSENRYAMSTFSNSGMEVETSTISTTAKL